jgi:hypothetical protein
LLSLGQAATSAVFSFYCCPFFLIRRISRLSKISYKEQIHYILHFSVAVDIRCYGDFFYFFEKAEKIGTNSMRYFYYLVVIFAVLEIGVLVKNIIANRSSDNNLRSKTDA